MASAIEEVEPVTERQFAQRLRKMNRTHREMIVDAMGNPPDRRNIPKELWKRIRDEEESLLLLLLLGFAMPFARNLRERAVEQLDTDESIPEPTRDLYRILRRRARWVATSMRNTSRTALRDAIDRSVPTAGVGTAQAEAHVEAEIQESTIEEIARDVMPRWREDMIVRTELAASRRAAAQAMAETLNRSGIETHLVWRLGPSCEHCKVCPIFEGLPESVYSQYVQIPVHPNCCCWAEVVSGEFDDLQSRGIIRQIPTAASIRAALRVARFRGPIPP